MIKTLLVSCAVLTMTCRHVEASAEELRPSACDACQTDSCQIVAERFAALSGDVLKQSPFAALTHSSGSGIKANPATVEIHDPRDLLAWAAAQTPPVEFSESLKADVAELSSSSLEQLPGTNLYAIHSVGGTAYCYWSIYFEVHSDGKATSAPAPEVMPDGACMVSRAFGTIDRTPVMFEEDYTAGPDMRSTLTVADRNADGSWAACRLAFEYEPMFGEETSNSWDAHCEGSDCARLQTAARKIVAAVQNDPQRARQDALATLTPSQQLAYDKAAEAMLALESAATTQQATDAAQITKESPFRLPYADGERLYIVSVGHFTIGWRYFADWSATFHAVEQDKLTESGSFALGMRKGRVMKMSIGVPLP